MRDDIFSLITGIRALAHTTNAAIANTTANGEIIDTQGETGGAFLVAVNGISAGTITPKIFASDAADMSGAEEVTDDFLVQRPAPITAPGCVSIGYLGIQRYIRLSLTGTSDVAGAAAHAIYASKRQDRGALS